jgi:hypothetical protein
MLFIRQLIIAIILRIKDRVRQIIIGGYRKNKLVKRKELIKWRGGFVIDGIKVTEVYREIGLKIARFILENRIKWKYL